MNGSDGMIDNLKRLPKTGQEVGLVLLLPNDFINKTRERKN